MVVDSTGVGSMVALADPGWASAPVSRPVSLSEVLATATDIRRTLTMATVPTVGFSVVSSFVMVIA